MSGDSLPATLFGVSRGLDLDELTELEDFLREAWQAQYGQPPSTLSADFERLRELFKTGASGKRLRDAAAALPRLSRRPASVSDDVFFAVGEHRGLVTPEGRALLEQLGLIRENSDRVLTRDAMLQASTTVSSAYGNWQRAWLTQQLGKASLRPGTYGVVLLLLLNGSVTRETALRLPSLADEERALAQVLVPVIDAFATELGGHETSAREAERLRSNWRLTEARRHLYELVRVQDEHGDAFVWVQDEGKTVALLAERLAARRDLDLDTLHTALDAAADAYVAARPKLATWGVAHDRTNHTRHVLSRIESQFVDERSGP
jgi:hypothetical protein